MGRILIVSIHKLNLLASLHRIILVYTTLISPNPTWPVQKTQVTQGGND
jgi:hypothetical protein